MPTRDFAPRVDLHPLGPKSPFPRAIHFIVDFEHELVDWFIGVTNVTKTHSRWLRIERDVDDELLFSCKWVDAGQYEDQLVGRARIPTDWNDDGELRPLMTSTGFRALRAAYGLVGWRMLNDKREDGGGCFRFTVQAEQDEWRELMLFTIPNVRSDAELLGAANPLTESVPVTTLLPARTEREFDFFDQDDDPSEIGERLGDAVFDELVVSPTDIAYLELWLALESPPPWKRPDA